MKRKLLFAALCVVGALGFQAQAQSFTGPEGQYYLQNVESGKYWGAGNAWGTQASLVEHPEYVTLHPEGSLYKLESQVSNGGNNKYFNGEYMDNDSPVSLTITKSGDYYTIANGSTYYGSGSSTVIASNTGLTAESPAALWKITSEADMKASLSSATVENPVDATFLILNPNFGRNNIYKWVTSSKTSDNKTNLNIAGGLNENTCAESYHANFSVTQTLSSVPAGVYKLTAQGFYRQDGSDNTNLPYFYIGTEKQTLPLKTGSENSMNDASTSFTNGLYTIDPIYVRVEAGDVELGVKNDNNQNLWCIWDNFVLTYYGDVTLAEVLLADKVRPYNEALAAAQGYQSAEMFEADKTALNSAITSNTIDLSGSVTEEQLATAATNLNAAAAAAAVAVSNYATYTTATTLINGGTNVDLTSLIVNPSFENGFTGWTNVGGMAIQGNDSFGKTGSIYAEFWQPNGTKGLSQTISLLPAGLYQLSLKAKARGVTSAKIYANSNEQALKIADEENVYTLDFAVEDKGAVTIGFEGVGTGVKDSWFAMDNFTLKYVGTLPDVTAVEGKMNGAVAQAQTDAIAAYNSTKNAANYNAATQAIANAQISKDAYAVAAAAIADAKALKDAHNFASATAVSTFAEAIKAIEDAYNDASLTDEAATAAGSTLGTTVSGWRANASGAASVYLNDGFSLDAFTGALYVNTWSTEGASDGSNFVVPFYENYSGDTDSLAVNTFVGNVSGLDNGLYQVSVWVRARVKNEVDLAEATGITIDVNGGEAVDVTKGTQVGETRFLLDTFTAEGLVKDGNLNFNVKVLEGTNISWLSFKNVKYTKVRDLTADEEATAPTAIALKNGEDAVTATIALDAATTSVTLTAELTPADATEGYIAWESSDPTVATVADGVVTAVSTGTATITATSTLDATVKATATVTVTFSESVVASEVTINKDAARTIYTLGENLIKNGSFEYPNTFYGWTTGGDVALSTSGFEVVASDGNTSIKAKNNAGGTDASSIRRLFSIESGKKYIFGFKVKGAAAGKLEWAKVSLTNTIGDETNAISSDVALTTSWQDVQYVFTNTEGAEYVQLWARWHQNVSYDDFYLCEVKAEATVGNVEYATAAIPTFNIGTGAFQYSQAAIDAANALVQGTATVAEVQSAYDALKTLNAPVEGRPYIVGNKTAKGGLQIATESVTIGDDNLVYFTAVEGGYVLSNESGEYVFKTTDNTWTLSTTSDMAAAYVVTVNPVAEGSFTIQGAKGLFGSDNAAAGSAVYANKAQSNNGAWTISEAAEALLVVNAEVKYGTFVAPFAVTIPSEVTAYTVDGVTPDGILNLTEVEGGTLAAHTPVVLYGETAVSEAFYGKSTEGTPKAGLLTGVYEATPAPAGAYVLQKQDDKVGFYRVGSVIPTVGANRAYLTVPVNANVRAFFFGSNEATAINGIEALAAGDYEAIYTLSGTRVSTLQKGVNILKLKNGKTVKVNVK